jgi:hypothetical protein
VTSHDEGTATGAARATESALDGRREVEWSAGERVRDHRALLIITIAVPLLEAVPLRYFNVTSGLAPQLTALTPFAVFHDVRWLFVFHSSWTMFSLELAVLLVVRTAFHAAVVAAAWPREAPRPAGRDLLRTSFVFIVTAVVVLSPSAALAFAGGATSLSWLQLAALPLFLLVALAISHGGIGARWWAELPSASSMGWTLLTFVVLNLASAAMLLTAWWLAWLAAGLAGLFNAWAWRGLVRSLAPRRVTGHVVPRTPLLIAGIFAVAIVVTSWQVRMVGRAEEVTKAPVGRAGARIPVLVAAGFDSSWDGRPIEQSRDAAFVLSRFSYDGSMSDGQPLPYKPRDTHATLGHLITLMDRQVRALAVRSREPVRIVAISEGSLVARSYVQAFPTAPVSDVVLVSPLAEPGRVYYPDEGSDGWGVAAREEMDGLARLVRATSGLDLDPDMPFLRSVVDHAPALRNGLLCPAPHARVVALLPIASDASIPPLGYRPRIPVRTVNGFHGVGMNQALDYLVSHRFPRAAPGADILNRTIRAGATAWMVPELPVALNPAWREPRLDHAGCPTTGWPAPAP